MILFYPLAVGEESVYIEDVAVGKIYEIEGPSTFGHKTAW